MFLKAYLCMKILYLTSWLPFPLKTGANVRNYHLIKYLSLKHKVDLLSFIFKGENEDNASGLKDICRRVKIIKAGDIKNSFSENITALFSKKPRSVCLALNREMAGSVISWNDNNKYDLIIADSLIMAEYVLNIKNVPKVIDHHNIDAAILKRDFELQKYFLKKIRKWLTWKKGLKYEKTVSSIIEAHIFVSPVDKGIMMDLIPGMKLSEVIPNGVDLNKFIYFGNENNERNFPVIVFSSLLKYKANLDGLKYFHEKIFPIIRKSCPEIKLIVTGDYSNLPVEDLRNDKNIEFAGYVDDVKEIITKAGVTIVPLRIGSGTRFKILESMALGTPVISTSIGAEGIEGLKSVTSHKPKAASDQSNIWIADNPDDFAKGVLTLLSDKKIAGILSKNGRRLIEENYSWEIIAGAMDKFLEKVKEKCSKQMP